MDSRTVPLINKDELDYLNSSITVTYKLDQTFDTHQRISQLQSVWELGAHPRNKHNRYTGWLSIQARMLGGYLALQTTMLNDTGSEMFTIYSHEARALGYNANIHATRPVVMRTANGLVGRIAVLMELRVISSTKRYFINYLSQGKGKKQTKMLASLAKKKTKNKKHTQKTENIQQPGFAGGHPPNY